MENRKGDWMITSQGHQFWPLDPRIEDIDIYDIAHALSMQCRFAGHVTQFYSVAQHCLIVSQNLPREIALEGLLHDASEAYLQDIIRPVKSLEFMETYRIAEQALERCIAVKYGLRYPFPQEVKDADERALMTEKRDLIRPHPQTWRGRNLPPYDNRIDPLLPTTARHLFVERFAELFHERHQFPGEGQP